MKASVRSPRPRVRAVGWICALAWSTTGCRTDQTIVSPDPHLNRMLVQEKLRAYGEAADLPQGMAMQAPPPGTLPVNAPVGDSALTTGIADGRWVDRIPVPLTLGDLSEGRGEYDTFCAVCHGILGTGQSVVADKMALRKPPSLHNPRIVRLAPGRVFSTIRSGYGLMAGYAAQVSIDDAWRIVGYVQALQLTRDAKVSTLPAALRARLAKEAP